MPPTNMRFVPNSVTVLGDQGVFENVMVFYAVDVLNSRAELDKILPTEEEDGKEVVYYLHAPKCSSPAAIEKVREHLDSGVLHKLTSKMVASYFDPFSLDDHTCFGYLPMVLGACAMSLGCKTLITAPGHHTFYASYMKFMAGIVETAPFMDLAKAQMYQALHGPQKYTGDHLIDFSTYTRAQPARMRSTDPTKDGATLMLEGMPAL
jgi:hypothetical protein